MSLLIGKAIYSILTGNTLVYSGVGTKIYPIFAPDETLVPFIVYERKNINTFYTKDGPSYDECSVVINIVSENYTECITIANSVRNALEWINGTYGGINVSQSLLTNASETYGIDGFITTLEFSITM